MSGHGYKKYMKQDAKQENPLIKIFVISFFGTLLFLVLIFNYIFKYARVDTSIGDYKEQNVEEFEDKKIVDMNRLEMIQNEDQGRSFSDLIKQSTDTVNEPETAAIEINKPDLQKPAEETVTEKPISSDTVYKVFIGSYTSIEQAKVAKEIIQESDNGLTPIVKCIGTNEYTLQVGIFKSRQSAEAMLGIIKKNNLPGRIEQE